MRLLSIVLVVGTGLAASPAKFQVPPEPAVRLAQDTPKPKPLTYTVSPGRSIQETLDKLKPGDRVQVLPGNYRETLRVVTPGITLIGLNNQGDRAVLIGRDKNALSEVERDETQHAVAIEIKADGCTIEGFAIRDYTELAVRAHGVKDLIIRDLIVRHTGGLGLSVREGLRVTVEDNVIGMVAGAGIVIAHSLDVSLINNEVYGAGVGCLLENSYKTHVENSSFHGNGVGLAMLCLPNGPEKEASYAKVVHNRIWNNNRTSSPPPGSLALPSGFGILIVGNDYTEILENVIVQNGSYGIAVMSQRAVPWLGNATATIEIDPDSNYVYVHHNVYSDNGTKPSESFKAAFPEIPPGDLYWDGNGKRNQWQEAGDLVTYPEKLVVKHGGVHTKVMPFI